MTIKQFITITLCVIITALAIGFVTGLIISDISNAVWLYFW